jgi:uncharacterized membrane protein
MRIPHEKQRDIVFVTITVLLSLGLLFIPSGFEYPYPKDASVRTSAMVETVNDSLVKVIGPITEGIQQVTIRVLGGRFKGLRLETNNHLIGKLELDKFLSPGDKVFVVLDLTEGRDAVAYANIIDHYRTDKTILLLLLFFACLIFVGGWIGAKAIISFIFSGILILKVFLPGVLWGWNPILIALVVVTILTAVIIFLVGGLTRKGLTAFIGSMGGVVTTAVLATVFSYAFNIHGAVRPFTETLLYTGFGNLNLVHIFIAGVFIASSGAVMDLAMDISAAMFEVQLKYPQIPRGELIKSGMTVARHAVGTMTTTLLLAYSGGYTGMMMTFIARGVPLENIINMVYVSSELIHTLVGSFGLVLVAPLTAVAGGFVYVPHAKRLTMAVLEETDVMDVAMDVVMDVDVDLEKKAKAGLVWPMPD